MHHHQKLSQKTNYLKKNKLLDFYCNKLLCCLYQGKVRDGSGIWMEDKHTKNVAKEEWRGCAYDKEWMKISQKHIFHLYEAFVSLNHQKSHF